MVKLDLTQISQKQMAKMQAVLAKDTAGAKRSPLTELGEELGIQIFNRAKDGYTNQKLLVYIPRMGFPTVDEKGDLIPFRVPMRSVTMKKFNNGDKDNNWAGSMPYFEEAKEENRVFAPYGQSGNNEYLHDYISAAFDMRRAKIELEVARQGYSSVAELVASDPQYKEEKDFTKNFMEYVFLQVQSNSDMWFPIVVIPTTKDAHGKFTTTPETHPLLDEAGNPTSVTKQIPRYESTGAPLLDNEGNQMFAEREFAHTIEGELKWHKLTTKAFTEKLMKAFELQAQQPGITELGGFFVLFNYEIDEQALAKAKKNGGASYESEDSKSGASLNIQIMQKVAPFTDLYDLTEYLGLQEQWDKEAQAHYNALYLVQTVRNCELLSDEEVNEKLDKMYGGLDKVKAEVENIQTTAENLKKGVAAGGSANPITNSAANRLGANASQLPPGVDVDPASSLDFGADE
jgi:hypothetical protein